MYFQKIAVGAYLLFDIVFFFHMISNEYCLVKYSGYKKVTLLQIYYLIIDL